MENSVTKSIPIIALMHVAFAANVFGATPTIVTLISSGNPSLFGHAVTLTAVVNSSSATGNVTFYEGTTVLGTQVISGGSARYTTSLLTSGSNSLKAYYSGDSTHAAATSAALTQVVNHLSQTGFNFPVNYGSGTGPAPVAVGDFNGDGEPDLVVANSVGVLLNSGRGVFSPAAPGTTPNLTATSVAVGDFNGDGKMDLALTRDNNVSVMPGNGDGSFRTATNYVAGASAQGVAAGDFNGDGKVDLAVVSLAGVGIFLGNGDGTFQSQLTINTSSDPVSVVIGDFDGDGIADLAIANYSASYVANVNSVGILLGKGDGTFQSAVNYPVGSDPRSLAVGDFNGDGKTDLVAANYGDNDVSVLLGNGDGTFQAGMTYAAGAFPSSVATADFDGDGKLDIVVANSNLFDTSNGNTISVFRGTGTGSFLEAANYSVGANPTSIAATNLTGSGLTDVAVGAGFGATVLRGLPTPGTGSTTVTLTSSENPSVYGQTVTLTATATPATATGSVTFYDRSTILGTKPLAGGVAAITTDSLLVGAHALEVFYSGDTTYAPQTPTGIIQTVSPVSESGLGIAAGYTVGSEPHSVVVGDFNGDGTPDVATANFSGSVSILLGNGAGALQAEVNYVTGPASEAIAMADFNGDGIPDLAVANYTDSDVSVLFGKGDGTFQPAVNWFAGPDPTGLVVGDFNGDGFADLAVSNEGLGIILGNGDGTFSAPVIYPAGVGTAGIAISDFNGDGKSDLVVINSNDGNASVFLGHGDGTFAAAVNYRVGSTPLGVVIGDFNGDGRADLAVADYNAPGSSTNGAITILPGNGNGTFGAALTYPVKGTARSITAADFNGDGKLDLAVGCSGVFDTSPADRISIFYGIGDGTFQSAVSYVSGNGPFSMATGDFNGDGRADLISANFSDNTVSVFLGLAPSTISLTASINPSVYSQPVTLTATLSPATLSGFVTFYNNTTVLGTSVVASGKAMFTTALLPTGSGSLRAVYGGDATHSVSSSAGITHNVTSIAQNGLTAGNTYADSGPQGLAAGDFNGDGKLDLVVANASGNTFNVGLLLGNGDGTFQPVVVYPCGYDPVAIAVGDFNGDGKLDFVAVGGSFNVFLGNGDGTFTATLGRTQTGSLSVAVGDFNADGLADLAITSYNSVGILLGNGDGTFRPAPAYATGSGAQAVATSDFNRDGKTDLVVVNRTDSNFSILLGNGDGTFTDPVNYVAGGSPVSVTVGDFNGDGITDLVVGVDANNSSSVLVFSGRGEGTFALSSNNPAGRLPQSIVVADFNGDGIADLAAANNLGNTAGIYYGQGNGAFLPAVIFPAGNGPAYLVAADFNGDGRADLAVTENYSNGVLILFGLASGPDLAITKSHHGTFSINQGGFNYTLAISNTGNASTSGMVTVTDTLPSGLAATGIGGTGWACVVATTTCTRMDPLAASMSYPAITVTVNVAANAAANLTNIATVSGGGDVNALNNTASDPTVISPVGQTPQTISFVSPGNQTGPSPIALSANSNSGLSVTLVSNTTGVCTVSGSTVTVVAVGNCSITASQPGNPTYAAATPVTRSFVINSTGLAAQISLTPSANPSNFGQALTLTATLTPSGAKGRVTFYDGVTILGTAMAVNGSVALTTNLLASGARVLRAYYGGDPTYAPTRSTVVQQTITALPQNSFATPVDYAAGTGASLIASGDFNSDGKTDLAVTDPGGNRVSLLVGNGDGTFQPAANIANISGPTLITAGDYNGDGRTDLAVACFDSSTLAATVNLLLNNGDGTFTSSVIFTGGTTSLTTADFNGDGIADIGATLLGGAIELLGNGDGTFSAGVQYGFNFGVASGTVGDFNGDGKPDFALAGGITNNNMTTGMSVVLGNGDRTLQNPLGYIGGGVNSQAILAGDFNGDGKSDIATASFGATASGTAGTLSVFLGNGDATFQPAVNYITGQYPRALTMGDFNGDGIPDLVVSNQYDNNLSVFLGVGDGSFQAGVSHTLGSLPMGIIAGDFNGDGKADLAIANSGANTLSVLLGALLPSQTITFAQLPDITFGTAPFTLNATASSGLAVTFGTNTTSICTLSGSTITIVGAGTCTISASQAGNANFGAAAPVLNTFIVSKSSQTIAFGPLPGAVFGTDQNLGPGLSASASSGLPVTFTSNTPLTCTTYTNATILVSAGVCSIAATQAGNVNYNAAQPVTQTFTISRGTQNINFPSPASFGNQGAPFTNTPTTLTATADSGLPVSYSSNTPLVCTVSGNALTMVALGTCTLIASQGGNANYLPATSPMETFNIVKGPQTITFPGLGVLTLSASAIRLTATSSSGLTVGYVSTTPSVCTVSGFMLTPVATGTCSITASQGGDTNYLAATPVTQSFTISPAVSSGGGGGSVPPAGGSPLSVSPASATISASAGGAPVTATLTLTYQTFTQGAPSFSSNFNTNPDQGWLSLSPSSGTMAQASLVGLLYTYTATITVTGDPRNLAAGAVENANVNITSGGNISSISVTMNVSSQPARFIVAPQSLHFSYQSGNAAVPATQSLAVFSTPAAVAFTSTASSTGNWLTADTGGATPGTIAVSVHVSGLAPGSYSGSIAIGSIIVPVSLTVQKANPPILSVSPTLENLGMATSGQVTVSNAGGGTLQFTAASDQGWLKVAGSGSATSSSPASLTFTADSSALSAGVYSGHIVVSDTNSAAQSAVTVVLTVEKSGTPSIQLSRTGVTLTAVVGGATPQSQTITVSNSGAGTLNWTAQASTTSGGNWLTVTGSGTSLTIGASANGLAAGQYYGAISVGAGNAANNPQIVSVVLNVLAASSPGISVSAGGVLLFGNAGQAVSLYNMSSGPISYSTSVFTANGAGWLTVSPASGTLNPGANSISIAANLSGLTGVQTGSVTLAFADGTTAAIQVVALPSTGGSSRSGGLADLRALASVATCASDKADYLIPIFREPSGSSSLQMAQAVTVQAQVVDDCGHALTAAGGGSVQVTFSNGDAGINLNDVGSGVWEGTWVPLNAAASVALQVSASEGGLMVNPALGILSTVTVSVLSAGTNAAPQPTGIANAASAAQSTPGVVAPGSYVAIYGVGLAASGNPSATTLPLPTTLNGTQLFLGGLPMPLLYAGAGQVNALVPEGIAPNATYPLVVVRGTVQSVPVALTVTELQPGAYTVNTSGSGAGIVTNALTGQLISSSNPAHAGDYLVIYGTGLGAVVGANGEEEPGDGAAPPPNIVYSTTAKVTATIGGVSAPVLFSGLTATFAGLYQVNLQVPTDVTAGSAVPVVLTATNMATAASATANTITIAVQ